MYKYFFYIFIINMSNINNRNGDDIIEQNMIGPVERLILKTQEIQNKRYQLNNSFLELIKLNKECEKKKITINEIKDNINLINTPFNFINTNLFVQKKILNAYIQIIDHTNIEKDNAEELNIKCLICDFILNNKYNNEHQISKEIDIQYEKKLLSKLDNKNTQSCSSIKTILSTSTGLASNRNDSYKMIRNYSTKQIEASTNPIKEHRRNTYSAKKENSYNNKINNNRMNLYKGTLSELNYTSPKSTYQESKPNSNKYLLDNLHYYLLKIKIINPLLLVYSKKKIRKNFKKSGSAYNLVSFSKNTKYASFIKNHTMKARALSNSKLNI